jgi:hypothetical protein
MYKCGVLCRVNVLKVVEGKTSGGFARQDSWRGPRLFG